MKTLRALIASLLLLSACTFGPEAPQNYEQALEQARAENLNHHASTDFEPTPQVVGDPYGDGVAASQRFFDASDTLIISDDEIHSQLRAASVAVVSHSPMVTMRDGNRASVLNEIDRLKARYVLLVGQVNIATTSGDTTVIQDPGTKKSLGDLTALQFTPTPVYDRTSVTEAIAHLEADRAELLVPEWPGVGEAPQASKANTQVNQGFPGQSKRDAEQTPLVIASPESSIAATATARAYGAGVKVMPYPDPRFDADTTLAVAGLSDEPLIALGSQFGTKEQLSQRILMAEKIRQWLPNDRGIVFSREPIYIEAPQWIKASTLIDGESFLANRDRALEWAETLHKRKQFGVLVFEPGKENVAQQVSKFDEVLALPNIGVAVDTSKSFPKAEGDGYVESQAVNAVAKVLASAVEEHQLAQKPLLIIAQEAGQIHHTESLNTNFPQVALSLAVDVRGDGTISAVKEHFERVYMRNQGWSASLFRDGSFIDGGTDRLLESEELRPQPLFALIGY
ncbi:hypothetical protein [Corynebacterium gerontici]|uniref:Lipoprotein n=1 Tax=Corynebacterium gerontici TaxID=2079234 RepID=A0A3G6J4E8_9CORY|nr:hypothetical protein [Corynebacterium gerontici]AZA11290.1 hypothetical protein CGERO_04870 [Corynebacterium gerontici]